MLKWLKRILLGIVALAVFAVAGGTIYEQIARSNARATYKPAGKLVDIGGRKMHLDCRGGGTPTVVLEAGLDSNGSLAWSSVHDELAAISRTCAYDRAGIMWSEPKSTPQDGEAVATDLHKLLAASGEKGPFVMAGHSLGGPYLMNYTRLYGDEVAGLVFVDASHADQFQRFKAAGLPMPEMSSGLPQLLAATSWSGVLRLLMPSSAQPGFPAEAAAASRAYIGTSFGSAMKEAEALDRIMAQGGKLRALGDRPLVVLTAAKPMPKEIREQIGFTEANAATQARLWKQLHEEEASWSTRSRHEIVPDAGHYIQFDRPDVVIRAVRDVVGQVRAGRPDVAIPGQRAAA
ncbi:alpha/beta fold hydrolase [Sphingosinicella rhizophila]|uniref:Alpha/beta hydrolase n=1 Tax=Sphingosinicella rhizophila TaxID=3050082 RepID=A0ABU3Q3Y5_9SPHN|nr:alpha/beta hydrolase [Sphingosinicella sp. GR2756]MDT9597769.1 alpha/beta hydrolase [Sphingosinicella sp. GR2756]